MSVRIFEGSQALAEAAAAHVAERINKATSDFHLCLSGGSTPKTMFGILASPMYQGTVAWKHVHFWWGDERFVPPTEPESNEKMARETLLTPLEISADHIHPMFREGSVEDAAKAYERELREFLGTDGFDLVLLGLGPDAHTASLFPGDPSIHEAEHWVLPSVGAAGVKQRITLTPPILNAAQEVLFLAAGPDKRIPLANVMNSEYDPAKYPAQVIARNARLANWFVDSVAASGL